MVADRTLLVKLLLVVAVILLVVSSFGFAGVLFTAMSLATAGALLAGGAAAFVLSQVVAVL